MRLSRLRGELSRVLHSYWHFGKAASWHNLTNPPRLICPMIMIQSFPSQFFEPLKGSYFAAKNMQLNVQMVNLGRQ